MKYYNEFADIYDDFSVGIGDLGFYKKQAKKAKGKVLEVACGTGRILLPLLKAGVDIEGFDISSKMLGVLNQKAKKDGLKPKVWKADMRNFRANKKYSLIMVPYRAFNHVESSADQIRALKNFRRHLGRGGRLVLNFFYPSYTYMAKRDGKRAKRKAITIKGAKYCFEEIARYEPIGQLIRVEWIITDPKGRTHGVLKIHLSYIYKKEFELLLRAAGFRRWKVYGGFKGEKLKTEKQEMVWIIER